MNQFPEEDLAAVAQLRKNGIEVPEYYNFAYDVVDKWAEKERNRLAMIWVNQQGRERKLTYFDLPLSCFPAFRSGGFSRWL